MDISNEIEFYCLNYNNSERRESMLQRFKTLDISCNFYDGVGGEDKRLEGIPLNGCAFSCMYGHLDMIYQFYHNTTKPFGIFCEDDILIHKDFKQSLSKIIEEFPVLKWDVLLLGYLITHNIRDSYYYGFDLIPNQSSSKEEFPYNYYSYPNEIWGAQMYMLTRDNAKNLLDEYHVGYLEKTLRDNTLTCFSSDYTITKNGNRMLLYPLLVIEDGKKIYDHGGQQWFHYHSYLNNYREDEFL
jgi:GR25 family glycosyltransferase involved in LPS biosynthesis